MRPAPGLDSIYGNLLQDRQMQNQMYSSAQPPPDAIGGMGMPQDMNPILRGGDDGRGFMGPGRQPPEDFNNLAIMQRKLMQNRMGGAMGGPPPMMGGSPFMNNSMGGPGRMPPEQPMDQPPMPMPGRQPPEQGPPMGMPPQSRFGGMKQRPAPFGGMGFGRAQQPQGMAMGQQMGRPNRMQGMGMRRRTMGMNQGTPSMG